MSPRLLYACPTCHRALSPRSGPCAGCRSAYERARRQSPTRKAQEVVYHSRAWRRFRAAILAERPRCEAGCGAAATEVAHIVPVALDASRAFEPSNVRSLCKRCHSSESARRRERWPRRGPG